MNDYNVHTHTHTHTHTQSKSVVKLHTEITIKEEDFIAKELNLSSSVLFFLVQANLRSYWTFLFFSEKIFARLSLSSAGRVFIIIWLFLFIKMSCRGHAWVCRSTIIYMVWAGRWKREVMNFCSSRNSSHSLHLLSMY